MRRHALGPRKRRLAVLLVAVTAASLAPAAAQAAPAAIPVSPDVELNLSVTEVPGATARTATLWCRGPLAFARGYLSGAAPKACLQARRVAEFLLSAPDPHRVCTAVFGGEQTAEVTGFVDGRRVKRSFARRNGCELADWNRMGLLLA